MPNLGQLPAIARQVKAFSFGPPLLRQTDRAPLLRRSRQHHDHRENHANGSPAIRERDCSQCLRSRRCRSHRLILSAFVVRTTTCQLTFDLDTTSVTGVDLVQPDRSVVGVRP